MGSKGMIAMMKKILLLLSLAIYGPSLMAQNIAADADKSVVYVAVYEGGKFAGNGSGFVIAPNVVVTNWHVAGERQVLILNPGKKDKVKPYKVQKLWGSKDLDVVFLLVENLPLKPIPIADKVPQKGHDVVSIGYPGAAEGSVDYEGVESTLTRGVIGRVLDGAWSNGAGGSDKQSFKILQHNASINKGNSGGPLLDSCGRVVGVNTKKAYSVVTNIDAVTGVTSQTEGIFYATSIDSLIKQLQVIGIQPIVEKSTCNGFDSSGYGKTITYFGLLLAIGIGGLALFFSFKKSKVITETYTQYLRRGSSSDFKNDKTEMVKIPKFSFDGFDSEGKPVWFEIPNKFSIGDEIIVGRDSSVSDIVISDLTISRKHAVFVLGIDGLKVRDLGSTNGTFVDDVRVVEIDETLRPGQSLSLGKVILKLKI